jgi:SAM-dependent methyltransferase
VKAASSPATRARRIRARSSTPSRQTAAARASLAKVAAHDELGAFDRVDESPVQPHLVDYLERVGQRPDMRHVDAAVLRLLRVGRGDAVLEAGSGLGDDAVELARVVGPSGHVVGVDLSADLVALAERRAARAGVAVEFRVADATALPFRDATFDGVRVERTLQWVPDVGAAVAELARVARPGGRVVAAEPDWGSLAVGLDDTEALEAVVAGFVTTARERGFHPRVGLHLPGLLRAAGLVDVEVELVSLVGRSRADAGEVLPMVAADPPPEVAEQLDRLPAYARWRAALDAADQRGDLVATLPMWVVGARKPGP